MKLEEILSTLQKLLDVPVMTRECPDDVALVHILEVVRWSPSAANLQPWEIIVARDVETKEKIVQVTWDSLMRNDPNGRAFWLREAPVVIVLCTDVKRVRARFGSERGLLIAIGDVGGFLLAFRIAAIHEGWTTGIVREFDPEGLRKALGIPRFIEPMALVAIGRREASERQVVDKPTMEVSDFFHNEKW
jgi:nitroreductase